MLHPTSNRKRFLLTCIQKGIIIVQNGIIIVQNGIVIIQKGIITKNILSLCTVALFLSTVASLDRRIVANQAQDDELDFPYHSFSGRYNSRNQDYDKYMWHKHNPRLDDYYYDMFSGGLYDYEDDIFDELITEHHHRPDYYKNSLKSHYHTVHYPYRHNYVSSSVSVLFINISAPKFAITVDEKRMFDNSHTTLVLREMSPDLLARQAFIFEPGYRSGAKIRNSEFTVCPMKETIVLGSPSEEYGSNGILIMRTNDRTGNFKIMNNGRCLTSVMMPETPSKHIIKFIDCNSAPLPHISWRAIPESVVRIHFGLPGYQPLNDKRSLSFIINLLHYKAIGATRKQNMEKRRVKNFEPFQ